VQNSGKNQTYRNTKGQAE